MLAADVDIVGLDGRHLAGWLELATPPGAAHGWALAILEDGVLASVVVAGRGAIDPASVPWQGAPRSAVRALRRHLGVGFCGAVEARALPELAAEVEGAIRFGDDHPAQVLSAWRAVKRAAGHALWLDPPLLDLLPAVSPEAVQTTFDLLIPDGTSVVAYVFEDDGSRAACSAIGEKRRGDIVRAAQHRALADRLSEAELARTWKTGGTARLLALVAERFAPASLGAFASRSAVERVLSGPADQLGRELRAGHIVLSPAPMWLLGLVGGAAAVGLATRGAKTALRFLPASARQAATQVARGAQDRLRQSGAHPFAALGFDPLEVLADLRQLYRR